MECEICGKEVAGNSRIKMDGMDLIVCENCISYGKEVKEERQAPLQRASVIKPARVEFREEAPLADDYGKRIRTSREKKGLTVKELANKLFEKESTVHKMENQQHTPEDKVVKKLEKFLKVSLRESIEEVDFGEEKKEPGRKITLDDLRKK